MNCSTPGLPVHHQPPESTQIHVHWVGDAIQPSHPLSSFSPPAPNLSQHQRLFQWVNSSHEVAKSTGVSALASFLPMSIQDWSPLGWIGWIFLQSKGLARVFSNTTVQKHQFFGAQLSSQSNSHIIYDYWKNVCLMTDYCMSLNWGNGPARLKEEEDVCETGGPSSASGCVMSRCKAGNCCCHHAMMGQSWYRGCRVRWKLDTETDSRSSETERPWIPITSLNQGTNLSLGI